MNPTFNGFPVWNHQEFKSQLRKAFVEQIEGRGNRSVLVMGDYCVGKMASVTEFCSDMSREIGLAEAPKKYGQTTDYINLLEMGQRDRPENDFDQLLKEDVKSSFALLSLTGDFIDYGDRIRYFEKQDSIGVLVLKLVYGRSCYDPETWNESYGYKVFGERFLLQLITKSIWENTRKLSDKVLIVATGIAQDGITPELGSEFHSKGLLYLSPEAWLTHAKATGIDPCVIDFVMTNPYSYLGINRLVTENGNIASEADIERWNTEESHIPWSIRYDDGCYPNPFKIQEVSNLLDFWKEEWRSNEGRYKVRDHYPNYYQYVQKGVGTFCGRKWAYDFAKFLVSIGDGKEFYS